MQGLREYDILLLGATGYTGSLTAKHIALVLPTNLRWAIAGRSRGKLESLADELREKFPDRTQPDIVLVSLHNGDVGDEQLNAAVRKATVCISLVSYTAVGQRVVGACVGSKTDYIDAAAIPPFLRAVFEGYHDAAKASGVALVHACGAVVAPMDLLAWAAVRELATKRSLKTREVILGQRDVEMRPSAGTVETMLRIASMDRNVVWDSEEPWALSPIQGVPAPQPRAPSGMRTDPVLGLLAASSFLAAQNRSLVNRTWALLRETEASYGPRFEYSEYQKAASYLDGARLLLKRHALGAIMGLLRFAPIRNLVRAKLAPEPGTGPSAEWEDSASTEMEAVAWADGEAGQDNGSSAGSHVRLSYPSGDDFLERVQRAGVKISINLVEHYK